MQVYLESGKKPNIFSERQYKNELMDLLLYVTRHYKRTNIIITGTGQAWLTKGQLEKARAVL